MAAATALWSQAATLWVSLTVASPTQETWRRRRTPREAHDRLRRRAATIPAAAIRPAPAGR